MQRQDPFIKRFIEIIGLFTLITKIIESFSGWPLESFFLLSQSFLSNFYLWQPLTSLILLPEFDFSLWALMDLIFILMLFSFLANQALFQLGKKRYIKLLGANAIVTCIVTAFSLKLIGSAERISLVYPILLSQLTLWSMSNLSATPVMRMPFPLSQKWILLIAIGATSLKNLFTGELALAISYTVSLLFTYFTAVIAFHLSSPFQFLWPFEAKMKRLSLAILRFWNWKVMATLRKWHNKTTIE
jgi:hypothetical protein